MEPLLHLLDGIHPISPELRSFFHKTLIRNELPKKHLLLSSGQLSTKMYFIEKGLIRGYYLKDDKDVTTGFLKAGDLVISPASFYTQQPSIEYIELLEPGILWSLTYAQLQYIFMTFVEFNFIARILTEHYYTRSELRTHNMRMLSAEERYEVFCNVYSPILNRVSNKHIASFLGISPETLSRIRANKHS